MLTLLEMSKPFVQEKLTAAVTELQVKVFSVSFEQVAVVVVDVASFGLVSLDEVEVMEMAVEVTVTAVDKEFTSLLDAELMASLGAGWEEEGDGGTGGTTVEDVATGISPETATVLDSLEFGRD